MTDWNDESLAALFPEEGAVSEAVRVDPTKAKARWLVDGAIRDHQGPVREVRSRVAVRTPAGLKTVSLGVEALLSVAQAHEAVEAAKHAWAGGEGEWPSMPVEMRSAAVERFASALEAKAHEIATLLMWEIGKPMSAARDEVTRSVDYIRNTVRELTRLRADDLSVQVGTAAGKTHHARTHRRALGVAVCVAPFNYPVNEFLTTVVPALLMGNVVIAKTPRFGALANLTLLEAFRDCFPKGVVALLPGEGRAVLPAVMSATERDVAGNPTGVVRVFAFIGSEGAANSIIRAHPTPITLHKVLGLGAKNPAVVMADANLERAAASIVKGALGFNGQRCTAEKIVFAHRSVLEALVQRISLAVESLKLDMPWVSGVGVTPLPEENKLEHMRALLDDALTKGAVVRNALGGKGWFSLMRPAVVAEVTQTMRLFHEEQFGPIVPIGAFDEVDEVLEWQRQSPFGQQAAVWGTPHNARSLVRKFTRFVARVNINDVCQRGPDVFGFSAAEKSGFGTLSLKEALLAFSRPVLVQSQERESLDAFLGAPRSGS
jgi:glyceraldehyde-3-phosphate dehydrogenase (NADP+)